MQQAQRVADETAFMYMGELIEAGKTENIFKHARKDLTKNYVEDILVNEILISEIVLKTLCALESRTFGYSVRILDN